MGNFNIRKKSANAKLKLLLYGVRDNPKLFSEFESSFKEEHYAYDNGNWGVDKRRLVPTEILLPGGIVSKLHIRPNSPLTLDKAESFYIKYDNEVLSEFEFLPRPNFWKFKTSSGIPTKNLAQMYGLSALNFNIFSGCEFHNVGKGCLFCSVKKTVDKDSPIKVTKNVKDLVEVCRLAVANDHIDYLIMTGGSYINRNVEFERNIEILTAIRNELPWDGLIKGNVSFLPPSDITKLEKIYSLGVTNPSFNIEVWGKDNFEKICPGKSCYVGFEHMIKSLTYLAEIYGSGKVWSNFVAGFLPLEELKSGFKFMAERGVVPGANIYHAEVGSALGMRTGILNEKYILDLYGYAATLYEKYDFRPYFDAGVLRNSLANEVYEGLL